MFEGATEERQSILIRSGMNVAHYFVRAGYSDEDLRKVAHLVAKEMGGDDDPERFGHIFQEIAEAGADAAAIWRALMGLAINEFLKPDDLRHAQLDDVAMMCIIDILVAHKPEPVAH